MLIKKFKDNGQLKKLMVRGKIEGAKINSILELITCLALKKLFQSYGASNQEFSNMVYQTVVSLRDGQRTGGSTVDQGSSGLVTGGLITHPDISAIENIAKNEDKLNELFWPLAKKFSDELHQRILHDPARFFLKLKPTTKDEINFHFQSSNLGITTHTENTNLSYFNLKLGSSICTSSPDANDYMFVIWFSGELSGNLLRVGMYFNSHFIDESIVEKFIENFNNLLNSLVETEPIQAHL